MVLFESATDFGDSIFSDHTHSRGWIKGREEVIKDIQPDRHGTGPSTKDWISGTANYRFADGHVEPISPSTLNSKIDLGINFAAPIESK